MLVPSFIACYFMHQGSRTTTNVINSGLQEVAYVHFKKEIGRKMSYAFVGGDGTMKSGKWN